MRREETGGRPSEVWVYGREKSEETEQSQAQTVEETEERPVDEKQRQAFLDSEPEPQELEA